MNKLQAQGPIELRERIQAVDILRGFALFGILLVNMGLFKQPWLTTAPALSASQTSPIDLLARWGIMIFAEGKFFTLFSFLFGFGIAMQMLRAAERGLNYGRLLVRRLSFLLLIGLIHALLIWNGDILVTYALLGLLLLLFARCQPRTLLIWALALLLLPALALCAALLLFSLLDQIREAQTFLAQAAAELRISLQISSDEARRLYTQGSYPEIVGYRLRAYPALLLGTLFSSISVLAMFLLGLYTGKRGILQASAEHLGLLRRVRFWGLALGISTSVAITIGVVRLPFFSSMTLQILNNLLAGPVLAIGYAATLTLLLQSPRWQAWLAPLAATGRMALSNYLAQSLICTTLFYGYGFGLLGSIGVAAGLLICLAIYGVQILLSQWWLARYRFGPAEWVWRSLTYGVRQPMRR